MTQPFRLGAPEWEVAIPRYHFNLVNSGHSLVDEEGVEASDPAAACSGALDIIEEVRADPELFARWRGWSIEVVDENGRLISSIPFDMQPQ